MVLRGNSLTTKHCLGILKLARLDLSVATICAPSRCLAGFGNHHGHADLAKVRVRHADHRAFGHAGQLVDIALDLGRIDVVAAADDQVLAAPDDGDVAVRVDFADVAGLEIAVGGELFGRFLGHAPVALEDIRPLDLDVADLARPAGPGHRHPPPAG